MAQLHTRGVGHALLPEVRWHGRDHGARSWLANLRDGIAALDALATDGMPGGFARARSRLLERLHRLLEETPRQVRLMDEAGGAETLLPGDLRPKNIFVAMVRDGPCAPLVHLGHLGLGPAAHARSTVPLQAAPCGPPPPPRPPR